MTTAGTSNSKTAIFIRCDAAIAFGSPDSVALHIAHWAEAEAATIIEAAAEGNNRITTLYNIAALTSTTF